MRLRGATLFAFAGCLLVASSVALPADSKSSGAVPLRVVTSRTPPVRAPFVRTSGRLPLVISKRVSVDAANAALYGAVVADERRYAVQLRRDRAQLHTSSRGVYRTDVDRRYLSASSTVVSGLLTATREAFSGQHGGDGWLGVTVMVDTGTRVRIGDLFADPTRGIPVLANAWRNRIRSSDAAPCLRIYSRAYTPTAAHFRDFAFTPNGLAVGMAEIEACYRLVAVVSYSTLRPFLSTLGAHAVASVRKPA